MHIDVILLQEIRHHAEARINIKEYSQPRIEVATGTVKAVCPYIFSAI